jgi:hypothetical protein
MIFFTLGIDQDVVNEDNDKLAHLRHEYGVHQVHEMCRNNITKYSYNPYLVEKAVLETSSRRILI